MSNQTTALESFKSAKEALLADFKAKESELAALRHELVQLGVLGAPASKTTRTRKPMSQETKAKLAKRMAERWAARGEKKP